MLGWFHSCMGALSDRPSVACEAVDEHLIVALFAVGVVMITVAVAVKYYLLVDVVAVVVAEAVGNFVNLCILYLVVSTNEEFIDDAMDWTFWWRGLMGAIVDVVFLMHHEE